MSKNQQSSFIQGGYYHVFNRGNRGEKIFVQTKDYKRYLEKLKEYKKKHNVSILAYCLMPNHLHFLIRQNGPEPISSLFQRLHTAYTMYFNSKYKTGGHLFEGRFKTKMVTRDEYIRHLSRYIHLNPLEMVKRLPAYNWSSYPTYIDDVVDDITDTKIILGQFKRKNQTQEDAKREYKLFVRSSEKLPEKIKDLTFKH